MSFSAAGLRGQRAEDDEGERQQSQQHSADGHSSDQSDGLGSDNKDFESKCLSEEGEKTDVLCFCYFDESMHVTFFFSALSLLTESLFMKLL